MEDQKVATTAWRQYMALEIDLWLMGRWDNIKRWPKYSFRDGFRTNIDLGSPNEIRKRRDEIRFSMEFVNLRICST
jgi:hypothetical protein